MILEVCCLRSYILGNLVAIFYFSLDGFPFLPVDLPAISHDPPNVQPCRFMVCDQTVPVLVQGVKCWTNVIVRISNCLYFLN